MIVFYSKKTGQIIASLPECYELAAGLCVSKDGLPKSMVGKLILSPGEAYDFEDPRNPKNIHDHKVRLGKRGKALGLEKVRKD